MLRYVGQVTWQVFHFLNAGSKRPINQRRGATPEVAALRASAPTSCMTVPTTTSPRLRPLLDLTAPYSCWSIQEQPAPVSPAHVKLIIAASRSDVSGRVLRTFHAIAPFVPATVSEVQHLYLPRLPLIGDDGGCSRESERCVCGIYLLIVPMVR